MSKEQFREIVRGSNEPIEIDFTNIFSVPPKSGDRLAERKFFSAIVVFLWPDIKKPELFLSQSTGATDRAARYWMDGTSEPSGRAKFLVLMEIIKRLF